MRVIRCAHFGAWDISLTEWSEEEHIDGYDFGVHGPDHKNVYVDNDPALEGPYDFYADLPAAEAAFEVRAEELRLREGAAS